jgi:ribosome-binding factor A
MSGQKDYPRSARMATQLRAELSALLLANVIHDPRVASAGLTVTEVKVSQDMGQAMVFVSSLKDDAALAAAVQGLNHAAGKLRHEIGQRIHVRYVPQLRFTLDSATRDGDRITALINQAMAEDRAHAVARGEDLPPKD